MLSSYFCIAGQGYNNQIGGYNQQQQQQGYGGQQQQQPPQQQQQGYTAPQNGAYNGAQAADTTGAYAQGMYID